MLRSSITLGRWWGTEIRLHVLFPVLLLLSAAWGAAITGSALRGACVFAALLFAVFIREITRVLTALHGGLRIRTLLLLPIGSVMALSSSAPGHAEAAESSLLWVAPVANAFVGITMLLTSYAVAPGVALLAAPWVTPAHVLRSFIWMQFLCSLLNLLPTVNAVARFRGKPAAASSLAAVPASPSMPPMGLASGIAILMIAAGFLTMNLWLVGGGAIALLLGFVRTGAGSGPGGAMLADANESLKVRDVMLTDCTMLSSSETLGDAVLRTVHSLQDVFPVIRGDRLVGSVSRATLQAQLQSEGDGYLQGVMTRSLQSAGPDEPIVLALRRAAAAGASEFIPVAEHGRMLGILTPQSLGRAVQQVQSVKRVAQRNERDQDQHGG